MKPNTLAGICRPGNEKAADMLPQLREFRTLSRSVS